MYVCDSGIFVYLVVSLLKNKSYKSFQVKFKVLEVIVKIIKSAYILYLNYSFKKINTIKSNISSKKIYIIQS